MLRENVDRRFRDGGEGYMPTIGYVALTLALSLAAYAAVVSVIGAQRRLPELILSARGLNR